MAADKKKSDTEKKGREDCLRKILTADRAVAITVVDATNLVQESMIRLGSWPPPTIHLGQALMGSILLLAAADKGDTEKLSLQWTVEGPFGSLYAEASRLGHARGTILYPRPEVRDLDTKLGEGLLQVRRITHTPFTGIIPSKGDVSLDLLEYLERSEQRRCGVNFTVKIGWHETGNPEMPFVVEGAYGYLIEILPETNPKKAKELLQRWDGTMRALGNISEWALGEDPTTDMLRLLSGEANPNQTFFQRIQFHCPCSAERAERALVLAANTAGQSSQSDSEDVRCEFCGKIYIVTKKYN